MTAAVRQLPKPDSGHTGTVSTTVRMHRGQLERHETPDPVRSNAVESRIQCVRPASAGVRRRPDSHDQLRLTGYAVLAVLM